MTVTTANDTKLYKGPNNESKEAQGVVVMNDTTTPLNVISATSEYETVAASATDQALGATGATGDFLSHIVIQPATTGAGTVTVKDLSTVIFTFTSGTLGDLKPICVPFNAASVNGAWKITTGANVAVVGIGNFT